MVMNRVHLDDESVAAIADAVAARHACVFDRDVQRVLHHLGELTPQDIENFHAALRWSAGLRECQSIGRRAVITTLIGACLVALGLGARALLSRGG